MENEATMAQLRNDARILRGKIREFKRNMLTSRPFSSRDLMILEDMLGDVEAEIRRVEKRMDKEEGQ